MEPQTSEAKPDIADNVTIKQQISIEEIEKREHWINNITSKYNSIWLYSIHTVMTVCNCRKSKGSSFKN